ncbi:MAG: hypothetical protein U0838_16060 [Chloroflexota bacterium]
MAPLASVPAMITFEFPATVALGGLVVRWETIVGAMGVLVALLVAAVIARSARSTSISSRSAPSAGRRRRPEPPPGR